MFKSHPEKGYTILEVLIFLTVSGFILVSALVLVNGRQEQIQFQQGVRNIDSTIRAAINDVSNGFFPRQNFGCSVGNDSLEFTATDLDEQGAREQCVFAGKAIEVEEGGLRIVTLAAERPQNLGEVISIEDAKVTPINDPGTVDLTSFIENSWGLRITDVVLDDESSTLDYVAYLSSFGRSSDGTGNIDSGTQPINLHASTDPLPAASAITPPRVTSSEAVFICIENNNGNRKAVIIVGKDGRQLTTSIDQDAEGKYEDQCGF